MVGVWLLLVPAAAVHVVVRPGDTPRDITASPTADWSTGGKQPKLLPLRDEEGHQLKQKLLPFSVQTGSVQQVFLPAQEAAGAGGGAAVCDLGSDWSVRSMHVPGRSELCRCVVPARASCRRGPGAASDWSVPAVRTLFGHAPSCAVL